MSARAYIDVKSIEPCTIDSQAAGSDAIDKHRGRDAGPAVTSSAELARLGLIVKVQAVWRGRMVRRAQSANSRVATLPGLVDDT